MYPEPIYKAMHDAAAKQVTPILQANASKNFVQRIINPKSFPVLALDDGNYATHMMAWAENDNGAMVYPTVIHDQETNTLRKLGDREAMDYAVQHNEFIPFQNPAQAEWFSENYKSYWGPSREPQ